MTLSTETPTVHHNGISLGNDVVLYQGSGAPGSTTLDGVAGPGSMYIDYTNKVSYVNKGTKATPSWEVSGGGGGAGVLRVYNGTGGALSEGQLVYLSGVDATTQLPKIVLADADVAGAPAEWVLRGSIADASAGLVYKTHRLTGQNDNTGTVGDERYLSTTAGAYTATAPTGNGAIVQVIGFLEVKSATVGVINIDLARTEKIPVANLQNVTATADEINELDDQPAQAQSTVSVAAEAGDAIAVTVQLKDAAGTNMARVCPVTCWLSSSATTGAVASDDSITTTATTGSIIAEYVDDIYFKAITNASGALVLSVAHAGDATAKYLWVEFPNGKFKVSAVIDLAA